MISKLLLALLITSVAAVAPAEVLSFHQWKAQRQVEAQAALERARQANLELQKKLNRKRVLVGAAEVNQEDSSLDSSFEAAARIRHIPENQESLISQAEHNLQVARNLSVTDYFALYLRFQSESSLREVVEKLSKPELAEILLAYRNSLPSLEQGGNVETPSIKSTGPLQAK